MSAAIDFTGPSRIFAKVLVAQGAQLAFRGGTNTVISCWSPVDAWLYQPWNTITTYNLGQAVIYAGKHFISDINGNLNQQPGLPGSLYWSLAKDQPQPLAQFDPQDGSPSVSYIPFVFPTGASMSYKAFNEAGWVSGSAVTISSGVAFQGPDLGFLFFTGTPVPFVTGSVG